MAVLRIHKKQQNFVILDKTCLNDESLSWGAKGLHAYLMSLPDDWRVMVTDLQDRAKNGRDAVRAFLKELEQAGFIKKTRCRNNDNGRYYGMEYVVLEVPDPNADAAIPPAPEKPFLVDTSKTLQIKSPNLGNQSADFQAPDTLSPGNTTLININRINNKKLNNKTAANSNNLTKTVDIQVQSEKAAAVFAEAEKPTVEDSVISKQLTANQLQRINALVQKLMQQIPIGDPENLAQEIQYCLLSPKHFTASGLDFGRKLNAIRVVMQRGDWQTPAGMVLESKQQETVGTESLEAELRKAHQEVNHFSRLLNTAKDNTRLQFEKIIERAKTKIRQLEPELC